MRNGGSEVRLLAGFIPILEFYLRPVALCKRHHASLLGRMLRVGGKRGFLLRPREPKKGSSWGSSDGDMPVDHSGLGPIGVLNREGATWQWLVP